MSLSTVYPSVFFVVIIGGRGQDWVTSSWLVHSDGVNLWGLFSVVISNDMLCDDASPVTMGILYVCLVALNTLPCYALAELVIAWCFLV